MVPAGVISTMVVPSPCLVVLLKFETRMSPGLTLPLLGKPLGTIARPYGFPSPFDGTVVNRVGVVFWSDARTDFGAALFRRWISADPASIGTTAVSNSRVSSPSQTGRAARRRFLGAVMIGTPTENQTTVTMRVFGESRRFQRIVRIVFEEKQTNSPQLCTRMIETTGQAPLGQGDRRLRLVAWRGWARLLASGATRFFLTLSGRRGLERPGRPGD